MARKKTPAPEPSALTNAERQARHRAQGKRVDCILTDDKALQALDALVTEHGSVKAALTAILRRQRAKA